MKKRILPLLAGIWPYLLVCVFLYIRLVAPSADGPVSQVPVFMVFCILLLAPVLALVCLLWGLKARSSAPALLAKWSLAVKLAHIPFYLLIFFLFMILPVFGVFLFLFDTMALIVSSGFGIAAVLRARKENRISTGWAIALGIAHCFFVTDVIGAFLLQRKIKQA